MNDLLSQDIEEAALAASLNPKTGERFSLDEVIDRNKKIKTFGKRKKVEIECARGVMREVPENCPIPGPLIQSTHCDWADGWYIHLTHGRTFREQPGPLAEDYKYSAGRLQLVFGWSVVDSKGETLLSVSEEDETLALPSTATLVKLWERYLAREDRLLACRREQGEVAPALCLTCGGKTTVYVGGEGHLPCPECNLKPELYSSVHVPLNREAEAHRTQVSLNKKGAHRGQRTARLGTTWRYGGEDCVVQQRVRDPNDPNTTGWVVLRKLTNSEKATQRQRWAERTGYESLARTWDDDWTGANPWRDSVVALDCMALAPVRLYRSSMLARFVVRASFLLGAWWLAHWLWPSFVPHLWGSL